MKQAAAAFSLILPVILLAACARTEDASVRPAESNESYSAVEKVRQQSGDEREATLGEWRRGFQAEQPALEFGPAGTTPLMTLICGERGGLLIQRPGAPAPGAAPMLSVTVGGQGRQLAMTPVAGPTPMQRAAIAPGDTLIQQLGAASAPIAIRFGDGTQLVLPQSPLIGQFAQGCATGFTRDAAGGTGRADGNAQAAAAAAQPAAGNEANGAAAR
jgi:hypothetical protein